MIRLILLSYVIALSGCLSPSHWPGTDLRGIVKSSETNRNEDLSTEISNEFHDQSNDYVRYYLVLKNGSIEHFIVADGGRAALIRTSYFEGCEEDEIWTGVVVYETCDRIFKLVKSHEELTSEQILARSGPPRSEFLGRIDGVSFSGFVGSEMPEELHYELANAAEWLRRNGTKLQ